MRKALIDMNDSCLAWRTPEEWLELKRIAKAEITSEDPKFPIESALSFGKGSGWRAATIGTQVIRLIFDEPTESSANQAGILRGRNRANPAVHASLGMRSERSVQRNSSPAVELQSARLNLRDRRLLGWSQSGRRVGVVPDTGPRCETGVRDTGRSAPRRVTQFGRYGLHKRAIRADQLCASAAICALEAAATARRIASKGGERSAACPLPGPQPPVVSPPRSGS